MKVIDDIQDAADGKEKDARVLFSSPRVTITRLTLRRGAALATHSSPDPLIIECVAGSGTLAAGEEEVALHTGRRVVLEADEPHAIVTQDNLTLILTRCKHTAPPSGEPHGGTP